MFSLVDLLTTYGWWCSVERRVWSVAAECIETYIHGRMFLTAGFFGRNLKTILANNRLLLRTSNQARHVSIQRCTSALRALAGLPCVNIYGHIEHDARNRHPMLVLGILLKGLRRQVVNLYLAFVWLRFGNFECGDIT